MCWKSTAIRAGRALGSAGPTVAGPRPPHTKVSVIKITFYDSSGIKMNIFILHPITFLLPKSFFFFLFTKLIYKTETDSEISKPNLWLPKGKCCGGEDKLAGWD